MSKIVIICSSSDPASSNIASRLLELVEWEAQGDIRFHRSYCMLCIEGELVGLRNLEYLLDRMGLSPRLIVFASRHRSKEAVAWLGGHFTGVVQEGSFELSRPAPYALKRLLMALQRNSPSGFRISGEATHHGPVDLHTPSLFAEIGSCEQHWIDPAAGTAVARAILELEGAREHAGEPVLLGIGGGHYVQRQTELMLSRPVAFGHMFSKYQASMLSIEAMKKAAELSGASGVYLDGKSFRSEERRRLEEIASNLDLKVMSTKDVRAL
ncbi:MAG: D-aminoacyl-tRNA deacylase [Methanothrix sp.]|uniref:D-aminoacyl-tRNA deacylase n=1 Tax=Methanothrix sp. TaxID=90426 RepID=UPI0025DC0A0D|nr:D-aminoacyl-tRNA deacylase [Methanothrix sp.]MCQ8903098.1 D-aminoacyl-tRNA deacylase [Methanothrix sp.]